MQWFKHDKKTVGTLVVDKSDPDDSPYFFLELEVDPQIIEKSDYITLKVEQRNYISQE